MNARITNFLSLSICAIALSATGCAKEDQPADTATTTTTTTGETTDGPDETETSDSGKETSAGTSAFVPDDDIAVESDCDPWAQDCPEGEKCAAYSAGGDTWDANKCVMVNGSGQTGDPCTYDGALAGTDDCDVGFMCYYTNEEAVGICVPQCTGGPDSPICEGNFNCSISNEGSLLLCLYACDPLLQDCQQEGAGCFWDGSVFNCDPAGDIPTNEPCGYINDCLPSHVCLDATALPGCNGSACCASFCDLTDPVCGIQDTECTAFFDEGTAPPELVDVGICILPGA